MKSGCGEWSLDLEYSAHDVRKWVLEHGPRDPDLESGPGVQTQNPKLDRHMESRFVAWSPDMEPGVQNWSPDLEPGVPTCSLESQHIAWTPDL